MFYLFRRKNKYNFGNKQIKLPKLNYKMKTLNLEKIWQIMNVLSYEADKLSEDGVYVYLLGRRSSYFRMDFESFLDYYSFKIDEDTIVVFNDDSVPYEDYRTNDFSYIPTVLLSFSTQKLNSWVKTEIELQLAQREREKLAEKENLKQQIKLLEKRLNKL